jgi:hypothetical protein
VLNNITLVIQKLADYLNSATPAAKGFIVALVAVGVVATTVTGAFIGLAGASVATLSSVATPYVFILAIVGPVLTRFVR